MYAGYVEPEEREQHEEQQSQYLTDCDKCAEYIMMRLEDNKLTEENLSMWIHDHFNEEF